MGDLNIPSLSSKVDPEVRRAIKAVESWAGSGELATTGQLAATGLVRVGPGGTLTPTAPYLNATTPPALTGFTATGAFNTIILEWDEHGYAAFSYVEIWRHVEDNLAEAVKVGTCVANIYTDTPPDSSTAVTYYYWARIISTAGIAGPYNASAGTAASTADDPTYMLQVLTNQITSSQLHAALSSRIDQIDEPVTGLVSQVAAAQAQLASVTSQLDDLVISVFDEDTAYAIGAKVRFETNVYNCMQPTTVPSPLPTDTDYWELIGAYAGDVAAQVATNAALAQAAADNAATAATNASSSATSAADSASAANTSVTLATTAKNSAQGYATAASASANSAAGSATDAATRATAAASSATAAATQSGQAQTYANQAANSATSAAGSANSASTSQGAAATSATNAANSATASSTSAGQAATYATNAANSATASQASRVAAETARSDAQGHASAASTSASAASVSASNAASSATAAAGSATTATTQAGTAQSYAGQAASSATNAQGYATSAGSYSSVAASSARSAALSAAGPLFIDPLNELCVGIGKLAADTPLTASSTFSVVANTSGVGSGQALSVTGSVPGSYVSTRKIHPVAMGRTYRLTMRVRKSMAGAGSAVYGGIVVMGADYSVLVSDSWVLASAVELSVASGWATYTYDYTPDANHKFLQLTALVNYSNGAGTTEISQLSVEDATESFTAGGYATAAATSASTASTSAGQAGVSASAAAASATQAATDRAQAGTYASQASTAAGNAATASTQASTYANTASGYAATASSAAATADAAANRYAAQYTLKVDANGKVAGIGLFSDSTTGSLVEILANRFAIVDPSAPSTSVVPFVVSGGNVYINAALIASATITRAMIQNLAVDSARIADAAISTAKVGDAQITTAKIAALAVTRALIADAAIGSAQIGDAAITTAKIGDAQVNTLKIAGDSVTIPLSAYTEASAAVSSIETTFQTLSVSSDGSPVNISCNAFIKGGSQGSVSQGNLIAFGVTVKVYRNSVLLYTSSPSTGGDSILATSWTATLKDTPPTGSVTYSFTVSGNGSGASCANRSITALVVKR